MASRSSLEPSVLREAAPGHLLPDPWPPKDAPFEVEVVDRVATIVHRQPEEMERVPPKPTPSCEPVSERLGRDACLAAGCQQPVRLTFPEDTEDCTPTLETVA